MDQVAALPSQGKKYHALALEYKKDAPIGPARQRRPVARGSGSRPAAKANYQYQSGGDGHGGPLMKALLEQGEGPPVIDRPLWTGARVGGEGRPGRPCWGPQVALSH